MKKYLLSLMVLLPFTAITFAQDAEEAEEKDVEEVVTTGIRSSLIDAITIKEITSVLWRQLLLKISVSFLMET